MKNTQVSVDMAEGQALLTHLPSLYYAIAQSAQLGTTRAGVMECSIDHPALGRQCYAASTAREAIRTAFTAMLHECTAMPVHEWPSSWQQIAIKVNCEKPVTKSGGQIERFQSKGRQFTIGVTIPTKLKSALQVTADAQNTTFADIARQFVSFGFEEFDLRSFSEDGSKLFVELSSELRNWMPSDTEQVMLRVDPNLNVRLRAVAQEFHRSVSEFSAMCIAAGVAKQTEFAHIQEQIDKVRGVKTRDLARQVGLGSHSTLLASILDGSVKAPRMVLEALGATFETSGGTLSHFFKRSFAVRPVPAFKAKGKPHLSQRMTSWKEAVKLLNLPLSESNQLLALDAKT